MALGASRSQFGRRLDKQLRYGIFEVERCYSVRCRWLNFRGKEVNVFPKCAAAEGVQLAQELEDRMGWSDAKLEAKWHSDTHACARADRGSPEDRDWDWA